MPTKISIVLNFQLTVLLPLQRPYVHARLRAFSLDSSIFYIVFQDFTTALRGATGRFTVSPLASLPRPLLPFTLI